MSTLIIGPETTEKIRLALERARAKPIPWEMLSPLAINSPGPLVKLSDRKKGFERIIASERVEIFQGYVACISFEHQPAGLCRHLSISVEAISKLPAPEATIIIAEEFGFRKPVFENSRVWIEEYAPNKNAINFLQIEEPLTHTQRSERNGQSGFA